MERYTVGIQTERLCAAQNVDGHGRHATELARQRPFSTFTVRQHTAEHAAAGSSAGYLLDFFNAIDCIKANTQLESARNIALLLDGVAIGDTVWRRACFQSHFDFSNRSGIEARAERSEQAQDFRRRICLHRIEDARIGQSLLEALIVVAHDVGVDDEARTVRTAGVEEVDDTLRCHGRSPARLDLPHLERNPEKGCAKNT